MTAMPKDATAVLLDRHPLWLDAVASVLEQIGVTVVGKTTDPDEGLALVDAHQPDIVITETAIATSAMDGASWLKKARERAPKTKGVVLSAAEDGECVRAAFDAGADAFVAKTVYPQDLASAVRQAFAHSVILPPAATGHVSPVVDGAKPLLTRRELEILRLAARGHSNAELARMLWVTEQTVKFHLSNVYRKLGVVNRTEAARWAQLHGVLDDGEPAGMEGAA
jgi:DNA-binding NarL/FixJ family response regulator